MPWRTQLGYAKHRNRSHDAVIRVYDAAGNVIETHKHKGDFNALSLVQFKCFSSDEHTLIGN